MRVFAADLRSTAELLDDLSDEQVADLIWNMNATAYWDLLVRQRGWPPEQFQDLLTPGHAYCVRPDTPWPGSRCLAFGY